MKRKSHKVCAKCKSNKPTTEFYKATNARDGLQSYCKDCLTGAVMRHYRRGDGKYKRNVKRRTKNYAITRRRYVFEQLAQRPCVDCGESNPMILDFDHVRGQKVGNVSTLASRKVPIQELNAEIAKCEARCVRCHRIKNIEQNGWYTYLSSDEIEKYLNQAKKRFTSS